MDDLKGTLLGTFADNLRDSGSTPADLTPGRRLGRYIIEELIGSGATSVIYKARHIHLESVVALKTVRQSNGPTTAERFLREARALALMNHSGVLRVYDVAVEDHVSFIVTELLLGMTLETHLERYRSLSCERAVDFLGELLGVLCRQEQLGILHRDIKPANTWVRADGSFCLFDYGLSGEREGGQFSAAIHDGPPDLTGKVFLGTPRYAPPELFAFRHTIDSGVDLYSLGMVAWECLTGVPAREGDYLADMSLASKEPLADVRELRPDVPPALSTIIAGLTAPKREDRYDSASEALRDLDTLRFGDGPRIGPRIGRVFAATPFAKEFDDVYSAIADSCSDLRLEARRVDRIVSLADIWGKIAEEIFAARAVVADFSPDENGRSPNANVVTEAAHARALGKAMIIMTSGRPEDLPFDWRHTPVLKYRRDPEGFQALRNELIPRLKHCLQDGIKAEGS